MTLYRKLILITPFFIAGLTLTSCASTPPEQMSTADKIKAYTPISVAGKIATPSERKKCEAVGGVIHRAGKAGYERCTQSVPDGFKVCTDSGQCLGQCVVNRPGIFPPGRPTYGICAMTDNPFDCSKTIIENGRAAGTLCVD